MNLFTVEEKEDNMKEEKTKKLFYTVKEFHALLGGVVTRSQVYKMISDGEIPTRRIGSKIVLPADWVNTYINTPCVVVKKVHATSG